MKVSELIRDLQEAASLDAEVIVRHDNVQIAAGDFTGGAAEDLFTATAHGWSNGDRIVLLAESAAGVVTGAVGDVFYVIDSAANTFRLSLTSGGAAVENTADGTAVFANMTDLTVNLGRVESVTPPSDGPRSDNLTPDSGYAEIG